VLDRRGSKSNLLGVAGSSSLGAEERAAQAEAMRVDATYSHDYGSSAGSSVMQEMMGDITTNIVHTRVSA